MKNNPLIAVGHDMKSKKEQENSLQKVEKRVELVVDKKSFEYLNKRTE